VVGVGGTSIKASSSGTYANETGWSGSGGGCSAVSTAPTGQTTTTVYTCGTKKSVPDISLVADPNTGLIVYDSKAAGTCTPPNCLWIFGGTSLAAPLATAQAVRYGGGAAIKPTTVYSGSRVFRDILVGNNTAYFCGPGLDKVTGRGSFIG